MCKAHSSNITRVNVIELEEEVYNLHLISNEIQNEIMLIETCATPIEAIVVVRLIRYLKKN